MIMKPKPKLNMDKIAKALGATRRGEARATSGHFGAVALAADVQARFRAPVSGGRSTDPLWTEKRLVPLAPETWKRLEKLAVLLAEKGVAVGALQVAALLLERATVEAGDASSERTLLASLAAASAKEKGAR
jgi:hypothetical protein